jgi:hypothetical protein
MRRERQCATVERQGFRNRPIPSPEVGEVGDRIDAFAVNGGRMAKTVGGLRGVVVSVPQKTEIVPCLGQSRIENEGTFEGSLRRCPPAPMPPKYAKPMVDSGRVGGR